MKNLSEKMAIFGFSFTGVMVSIAYSLGGFMTQHLMIYGGQTDWCKYTGAAISGFVIPYTQILIALALSINLPTKKEKTRGICWCILCAALITSFSTFLSVFVHPPIY